MAILRLVQPRVGDVEKYLGPDVILSVNEALLDSRKGRDDRCQGGADNLGIRLPEVRSCLELLRSTPGRSLQLIRKNSSFRTLVLSAGFQKLSGVPATPEASGINFRQDPNAVGL